MTSETGCVRGHRVPPHRPQLKTKVENEAGMTGRREALFVECLLVPGTVLGTHSFTQFSGFLWDMQ